MPCPLMGDIDDVRDQVLRRIPELQGLPQRERDRFLESARERLDHNGVVDRRAFLMNVSAGVVTIIGSYLLCPDVLRNRAEGWWTAAWVAIVGMIVIFFGFPRLKCRMMVRELWKILPTRCHRCGCDLRTTTGDDCPKCGTQLMAAESEREPA